MADMAEEAWLVAWSRVYILRPNIPGSQCSIVYSISALLTFLSTCSQCKIGCSKDGKLSGIQVKAHANCGQSLNDDYSFLLLQYIDNG